MTARSLADKLNVSDETYWYSYLVPDQRLDSHSNTEADANNYAVKRLKIPKR